MTTPQDPLESQNAAPGDWVRPDYEPGLVSVIIPTYNRAPLLVQAMHSVWAQTYRPIELIVVDDGSTDNTAEVVEEWGKKCESDDRFTLRYFRQKNRGAAAARNFGFIKSRGEFIQFLDSDDLLDPRKCDVSVRYLQAHSQADNVVSNIRYLHSREPWGLDTSTMPSGATDDLCSLLVLHCVATHGPLHRRRGLLDVGGFDESLPCSQETDLHLRQAIAGVSFHFIPDTLGYVKGSEDGVHVSGRLRTMHKSFDSDFYRRILKYALLRQCNSPGLRQAIGRVLERDGKRHLACFRILRGMDNLQTARTIWPRSMSRLSRFYCTPMGAAIGVVAQFSVRLVRAVRRRVTRMLGFVRHSSVEAVDRGCSLRPWRSQEENGFSTGEPPRTIGRRSDGKRL